MKFLLICRNLRVAGGRVVGINFIKSLKDCAPDHKFLILAPPNVGYEELELPEGSRMMFYEGGSNPIRQWKYDTIVLPKIAQKYEPDVVFAMGNIGLVNPPCPQALLFHRPHLVYPSIHYSRETKKARFLDWFYKRRVKSCLKKTKLVFCQTDVVKSRFNSTFNFPLDKIEIMPNAVSTFVQTETEKVDKPSVFSGSSHFNLFYLTRFYAHKNLEILLELFRNHTEELKNVRCILTINSGQHPNASDFLNKIRFYGLEKQILNVGPLNQDELAGYFCHADALLFPTLMESFSGTYLEAMHFGLPILTSDLDFAQYTCDNAAIYFDPWDPADLAAKITLLRTNPDLSNKLIRNGKKRIEHFFASWKMITKKTISKLEDMVN